MSELDPTTGIIRSIPEAQIIEVFKKSEDIRIERLDEQTVKVTYEDMFGTGSVKGNSVLNVLIHAMRAQKNQRYWDGYKEAEEKAKQEMIDRLELLENHISELKESIALLRETTDTAIKHLAGHVSHLALQLKVDRSPEQE